MGNGFFKNKKEQNGLCDNPKVGLPVKTKID